VLAGYCGFDALLDGDLSPNANARVFIAYLPLGKVATLNLLHCGGWGARHRFRPPRLDFYKGALCALWAHIESIFSIQVPESCREEHFQSVRSEKALLLPKLSNLAF
jgi:hypothetical protein